MRFCLGSGRPFTWGVWLLVVSIGGGPAFAAQEAPLRAVGESSAIKPRAERQIGKRERPTIKKRAETQKQAARERRVSLQIPERLRARLADKIDRRISRNLAEGKRLRKEAHALLSKLIRESPADAAEMPEAPPGFRLNVTRDRDRPNRFFTIVEFPSYEVAMDNSGRPETDAFAERMAALCTRGPIFYNLDVQRTMP